MGEMKVSGPDGNQIPGLSLSTTSGFILFYVYLYIYLQIDEYVVSGSLDCRFKTTYCNLRW